MTLPLARLTGTHITASNDGAGAMRYCEDCRFHEAKTLLGDTFHLCRAPQNARPSGMGLVVRGASTTKWMCETASVHRDTDNTEYCGRDGRWFEPKQGEQVAA